MARPAGEAVGIETAMIARFLDILTGRRRDPAPDPATEHRVRALYEAAERDDRAREMFERARAGGQDGRSIVDVLHRSRPPVAPEHRDDR